MKRNYVRKKGKNIVGAKKLELEGVMYKSPLEYYMANLLTELGIYFQYEPIKFKLQDAFDFKLDSFERQSNGKGEFRNRGSTKVRERTYTPDFIGEGFIIETKGYANEAFPDKWKSFKQLINKEPYEYTLYKPQSQKECQETARLILSKEEWRDVVGYEGLYKVSNYGRVKRGRKVLKSGLGSTGYPQVTLSKDSKRKTTYVHILVADSFLDNPDNLETVNHIDEVKTNNSLSNLERLSKADNIKYSKDKPIAKLDSHGNILKRFDSILDVKAYGFSPSAVSNCLTGRSNTSGGYKWKYLT